MNNIKLLLSIFLAMLCSNSALCAQIVYPKATTVTINSPVTFFIGNENPDNELFINDEKVKLHSSGGFYHVVKLNIGENTFKIDNKMGDTEIYKIIRQNTSTSASQKVVFKQFDAPIALITKNNNVPLRNAPNASGSSRLQHLQKDIPLVAVGEYSDYYKIELAKDDFAWIDKNSVIKASNPDKEPATLISNTYNENNKLTSFAIKLNKKVPYVVSEKRVFDVIDDKYEPSSNGIDITLYNVQGFPENKYEITLNSSQKLFGYSAYFTDANEFIISAKKVPAINNKKPLKGLNITLDPGHGGNEYGAIGCLGDKEKDINLAIALKTKDLLTKAGANVFITRDVDKDLDLYDRVQISKANDSDIFISIHANALPDSLAQTYRSGTSTYYFYPQSAPLARSILNSMTKELGTSNDKVHQESFAVIRNTESLAVLVEVAYMINPEDNSKLINKDFQQKAAQSIVHGIERYINDFTEK